VEGILRRLYRQRNIVLYGGSPQRTVEADFAALGLTGSRRRRVAC
jgi:hypothetical protein